MFKITCDFVKEEYLTIIIIKWLFNYTTTLRSYYLKEHAKIHDDEIETISLQNVYEIL